MDMKQAIERLTPEPERLPNWDSVLRDARPSRARWAAPRLAIVAAVIGGAALIAVAPWKSGERAGVLDRALAAVGDGPVSHLVIRTEWGGTLVDLQSGRREPLYHELEFWQNPDQGMVRITRFGGQVQDRSTASGAGIEKPLGVLTSGYREALEDGRARVAGQGAVDGIPVYWIQIQREVLHDDGDGRDHVWAQEVGVSRDTYAPVYLRETRDGKLAEYTGARILLAEQLPEGSGDFRPQPRQAPTGVSFGISTESIDRGEAQRLLEGRAAWLGERFGGLPLAKIGTLTMRTRADEVVGVHLTYGTLTNLNEPDGSRPFVTIEQAPRRHAALERGIGPYHVPKGHVALTPGGHAYLFYRGTYVAIRAESEDQALSATRALRPLSAGSGAGG